MVLSGIAELHMCLLGRGFQGVNGMYQVGTLYWWMGILSETYTDFCSGHLHPTNTTSIWEAQPSSHTSRGPELQGPSKLLYPNPTVAFLPTPAHSLPSSQSQSSHVGDWDRREEGPGLGQEAKGTDFATALRAGGL